MVTSLFSPAKVPWFLCTISSFLCFCLFTQVSQNKFSDLETGLLGGFCVWGCTTNFNSHMIAFVVDILMTAIAVFLYFTRGKKISKDANSGNVVFLYAVARIGAIICFHGVLHLFLSVVLKCLTSIAAPWLEPIGWFLYLFFTISLSLVIIGFGFAKQIGWTWVGAASAVVTLGASPITLSMAVVVLPVELSSCCRLSLQHLTPLDPRRVG